MPEIYYQPVNRRAFLRTTVAATLGLVTMQVSGGQAQASSVKLALLSDLHAAADPNDEYRKFKPTENLKTILPKVLSSGPEGVLINGDLARLTGELADYKAIQELLKELAGKAPIYMDLGNHDERENFWKVYGKTGNDQPKLLQKHVLVLNQGPVRILMLDSLLYTNKSAGLLGKTQRAWLGDWLKVSDEKPTIIFVHHTLGENDGELLDAEKLLQTVEPYRKVKAIFYGHSHDYNFKKRGKLHLVNLPALGYNFRDSEPVGWVNSEFFANGVNLTLHAIGGDKKDDGKLMELRWT